MDWGVFILDLLYTIHWAAMRMATAVATAAAMLVLMTVARYQAPRAFG